VEVNDVSSRILAGLLEARTGQQLTLSRRWRIETALQSLMRERGLTTLDQLIATLVAQRDPALSDAVVDALLNNETFFFRDRAVFDLLRTGIFPRLRAARAAARKLSIWCAGCSTGQEAYSLAMGFAEDAAAWAGWKIELVATDVSAGAIEQARSGIYTQFEVQRGLPVVQMMRWFEEQPGKQWSIAAELRKAIDFRVHSLMDAPPAPGTFDLILCRNVLLYFSAETRAVVLGRLVEASAPDAALMLGAGETVVGQTDEFIPDADYRGLYKRTPLDEAGVPVRFNRRAGDRR
jgi:chemotaxis protein methyltransferase CheR